MPLAHVLVEVVRAMRQPRSAGHLAWHLALALIGLVRSHVAAFCADAVRVLRPPREIRRLRARAGAIGGDEFRTAVLDRGEPVVLEAIDLGGPTARWTPGLLAALCGDKRVAAHACGSADLEWTDGKNFRFEMMAIGELIALVWPTAQPTGASPARWYYLRSVGEKMRTQPADLRASFPRLAEALSLPAPFEEEAFFSSALRVSSGGLALWTHNDTMENLLVQLIGTKQITLWPPCEAANLGAVDNASACGAAEPARWRARPALARARGASVTCTLRPGEVLYIPPLWFHHVRALDACASVNVFWRGAERSLYARKDLYGNRELAPAEKAIGEARAAAAALRDARLPQPFASFYAERLADAVRAALAGEAGGGGGGDAGNGGDGQGAAERTASAARAEPVAASPAAR